MTGEGKLESEISGADSMTLRLKVDRRTLDAHELALVNGLFFDGRTETSTSAVKRHYKGKGFDPAQIITPCLERRVKAVLPPGDVRVWWLPGGALILAGAALLAWTAYSEPSMRGGAIEIVFAFVVLGVLVQVPGRLFRARIDWGLVPAASFMIPALLVSLGTAAFLWLIVGTGRLELPLTMIGAITAWTIYISNAWINGMKSRQNRDAIAFRKRLAAGRRFFLTELEKPDPVLRDNWYPWLLSFGLGKQIDLWSTRHTSPSTRSSTWDRSSTSSSSSSPRASSRDTAWTGGGGRSGGAGASATWAAAATGMAAGVATPSSSSSGGGGGVRAAGDRPAAAAAADGKRTGRLLTTCRLRRRLRMIRRRSSNRSTSRPTIAPTSPIGRSRAWPPACPRPNRRARGRVRARRCARRSSAAPAQTRRRPSRLRPAPTGKDCRERASARATGLVRPSRGTFAIGPNARARSAMPASNIATPTHTPPMTTITHKTPRPPPGPAPSEPPARPCG